MLVSFTQGLLTCPFCKAEYALIRGSCAKCPSENDADPAWRIVVAGNAEQIWIPKAEGDEKGLGSSQIPKQEQSREEASAPPQQSSSCGPGKWESAPPTKAQKQPNFWSVKRQKSQPCWRKTSPELIECHQRQ